jgi:2-polyprenyl-6-methoxyphenol hydroxylase-like FAD-dependent oxidoreductase
LEPNGVRAFDWLGLGDRVRARSGRQGLAGLRTKRGRWLVRVRLDDLEERFGAPALLLHRADVHDVLLEGLVDHPRVTLHTGRRATTVTIGDGNAEVAFDRDGEALVAQADVVVGAEGVHSAVRSALFPHHARPTYASYITWRAVVPAEAARGIAPHPGVVETWGRGRRFGVAPLPDGSVYWFYGESAPEGAQRDTTVADLAGWLGDWPAPIPELLAATPSQALLRHDIYTLTTALPSYRRGRVVLLGDAAHAITPDIGQGAALALEDAVTLAIRIGNATSDAELDAGLDRYDHERRPRTQRLVRTSALIGRFAQAPTGLASTVRDAVAALLPARVYLNATASMFSWTPPEAAPTRSDATSTDHRRDAV